MVAGLVDGVRVNTVAYLEANRSRLIGSARLVGRFDEAWYAWSEKQILDARQITETVNELLIAKRFLQESLCARLDYEPPLDGSDKTIDFVFHTTQGERIFYDAKTIHPTDKDAWERYEKMKYEGWFAPGTHLILDAAMQGGTLAHHFFAARQKFLQHSLELDEKFGMSRIDTTDTPTSAWCSVVTAFSGIEITLRTLLTCTSPGVHHGIISRRWKHPRSGRKG